MGRAHRGAVTPWLSPSVSPAQHTEHTEGSRDIKWLISILICTGRDVRGVLSLYHNACNICAWIRRGRRREMNHWGFCKWVFFFCGKAGPCCIKPEPTSHPQGPHPRLHPVSAARAIWGLGLSRKSPTLKFSIKHLVPLHGCKAGR